ncbi:hypothetical protein Q3G72_002767 [Acer saccharum]|nr:hypothetical protein Q3G72_002767 [Acer saccharum]
MILLSCRLLALVPARFSRKVSSGDVSFLRLGLVRELLALVPARFSRKVFSGDVSFLRLGLVGELELFWSFFSADNASLILNIPCPNHLVSDSLMWHYDKWGSYSIKSDYHLDSSLASNPSSSSLSRRCLICKCRQETTMHALWCCPVLKPIHAMCQFMKHFKVGDEMRFIDFMTTCRNRLNPDDLEVLCLICGKFGTTEIGKFISRTYVLTKIWFLG